MERKFKIFFVSLILVALLSAGKVAADLVTQASNISLTSDKTSKTKVSEALDELYGNVGKCPDGKYCLITNTTGKKCIRATTLHTATCSNSSNGCKNTVGNGNTITYGSLGTSGTISSGDAFTCDVNGDGMYDETTERFYYVSDLWTSGNSYDTNYAVLIYYSNITIEEDTIIQNNGQGIAYYNENGTYNNYSGPITALAYIPSATQWSNVSLKSQTRQIYSETGGTTIGSRNLPSYIYTNKVARLLTVQELNRACNITVGSGTTGELDTCLHLLENTKYDNYFKIMGYWLETPYSSYASNVWGVFGSSLSVNQGGANNVGDFGVRPAIEVLKSDIAY